MALKTAIAGLLVAAVRARFVSLHSASTQSSRGRDEGIIMMLTPGTAPRMMCPPQTAR